jgi:hypothetical protein
MPAAAERACKLVMKKIYEAITGDAPVEPLGGGAKNECSS